MRSMVPRDEAQQMMDRLYEIGARGHPHHRHPRLPALTWPDGRRRRPPLPRHFRPLGVRLAVARVRRRRCW